jgi:polyphosphate kinase 2 (PPK2 family)
MRKLLVVIVVEWHAATTKGGAIRQLVYALDPRRFTSHATAAPKR